MDSNKILNDSLIVSGRDIPLNELVYAKRVLDNYMVVANDSSPVELLEEMKNAAKSVEYFKTTENPCEARNFISALFVKIESANTFEEFKTVAGEPSQALLELIQDRAQLIKQERDLLVASGYMSGK
ncbi:hypothetical protein [Vibrio sonorensis]|uniref:hypothetical protein n=1 Tax=Vibrio sonorensis TaxID=1004316 RepID=UPI0008D981E9|nr:hypothetical protein [Vibrio sonorensis]